MVPYGALDPIDLFESHAMPTVTGAARWWGHRAHTYASLPSSISSITLAETTHAPLRTFTLGKNSPTYAVCVTMSSDRRPRCRRHEQCHCAVRQYESRKVNKMGHHDSQQLTVITPRRSNVSSPNSRSVEGGTICPFFVISCGGAKGGIYG